ncbi:MAG: TetR/AcrR family transcriptional regulator [Rhizobiaceae bacterium]|nr:TetR/AcrR family transcriptional regulator [Rhizobiaceae bacterium]
MVLIVSQVDQEKSTGSKRAMRADARQNEDILLQAAKEVFVTSGVDAPVREIASKAGVGIATLYRRFPKRSDLISAVFRREVDACTEQAAVLAASYPAGEALARWLKRFTGFLAAKKGLVVALHSGDPAYDELPTYFRSNFEPALAQLLDAAAAAGEIRRDIEAYDLLRAIAYLSMGASEPDGEAYLDSMLGLLIDGLKFGVAENEGR